MNAEPGVSRTAAGVGMMRALHRIVDAEPMILDDPVSLALFGDAARRLLETDPGTLRDPRFNALRGHVLLRSAFAEARLRAAVARGVRQCVALGAGFDTFAFRQPSWMSGSRLFEVDAPLTQAEKRRFLARAGFAEPANLTFAPIDFETTTLAEGLRSAGFDASAPAFFSALGVLVYLTGDAIDAIFRYIGALPKGSEFAFTFTRPDVDRTLELRAAELGETFRSLFEPEEIEAKLRASGFTEIALVSAEEAKAMLGPRRDALSAPRRTSMAAATV